MKLLLLLIGMVLILEGLPYVASPVAMQEWLVKLSEMEPRHLRTMGAVAMVLGFLLCFFVQRSGLFV
ncbi:DUF2065 domain-containing protein [Desulfotalea psychrophila]|nr:DUF2065 domain-containing protein [Desulfotalea psychrophila]